MTSDSGKSVAVAAKGLKGVKAADSTICLVNGTEGRLLYRGYNIDSLAENCSFEEVAFLLLNSDLPTQIELEVFSSLLVENRTLPEELFDFLKSLPADANPMASLRTAISLAGIYDPSAADESPEANYEKAVRLTAQIPTIIAAIHRLRNDNEIVQPNSNLGHAANFMYMFNGAEPTADEARAMDLILILHAEHGFNASTFTSRVIIATLTDMYSAVTGAVGALKGKLHGGANTEVLKTLEEIGSVENVEPWVEDALAAKKKFMGFGHAVYQTADPRAKHLKALSERLGQDCGDPKWYEMSVEMEKLVVQAINKNCNVDFYSASLQHYLGVPGDLFTCIFAASRITGWCAHVLEQLADNKIIRPSANYTGPEDREVPALADR